MIHHVQAQGWLCRQRGGLAWGVSHAIIAKAHNNILACGAQSRLRPTTLNSPTTKRPQTTPCLMCARRTKGNRSHG